MTSDGCNVERLTYTPDEEEMDISAALDGSSILFSRGATRIGREIYRLDVASGQITQLTNSPYYDEGPVWSPDGSQIAFSSDRDGPPMLLYLMNPDGSDQRHIPLVTDPGGAGHFSWAPDSRHLVYGTTLDLHTRGSHTSTLFIADIATLEVKQLTAEKVHGNCFQPNWSPDGEWIAMICTGGTSASLFGEIYVIRPDGSEWRQVTERPSDINSNISLPDNASMFYVREPVWSPDSKEIVYAARINSPWNIYAIGADGRNQRRLTDHDSWDWDLSVFRLP